MGALGDSLARQNRPVEAERAYVEAVQLAAKLSATDIEVRIEAIKGMAWFYEYDVRWADANGVHRGLLSLVEDRYGVGSLQAHG